MDCDNSKTDQDLVKKKVSMFRSYEIFEFTKKQERKIHVSPYLNQYYIPSPAHKYNK